MNQELKIEQDLSKKVVRNTAFNIIGRLWHFLVILFLTPYIIGHIGVERFGVWAFVSVLTGYFGLLDLGVGFSFIKYTSEFYAKKDYKRINQLINTGFNFYLFLSVVLVILAFFVIKPIILSLKIPANLHGEASLVFLLGFLLFAIINAVCPFMAIQSGLQRMDITNKVEIAMSVPKIIGTVFFLEKGYGLPGLMVNSIIIFSIQSAANIIINYRILPELKFNPFLFSKDMFKKIFNYGYKLQVANLSSMISVHFDKLLITYFLSIGLVTFYQLGETIVGTVRRLSLLLVSPLIPAFSEIRAKEQMGKLIDGYTKGTKYLALLVLPIFSFVIISAPQIMMVWMGPGYEKSAWVIRILGFGWLAAVSAGVSSALVQAMARTDIEMKSGLIAAILNVPLSIILITKFGFAGVVFGTSIALICAVTYYLIKVHKAIKVPLDPFLNKTILRPLLICLCIGLPIWYLSTISLSLFSDSGRINSLIIFIAQATLFFGLYIVVLSLIKPLDKDDSVLLLKHCPYFARNLLAKFTS